MGISDEINDWINKKGNMEIPSIDIAFKLLEKVRDKQDREAFDIVLRIYERGAKVDTEEQLIAMSIISDAYRIGCIIFK